MQVPAALLAAFPPSHKGLLDAVRRGVDDAMLWDIAKADYGNGAEVVFPQLLAIRNTGEIPTEFDFNLLEVLSLTNFCNPDKPNLPPFAPGPAGRRGHQTRLFAGTILLVAQARRENREMHQADGSALANALTSCGILGEPFDAWLAKFLAWRLPWSDSPIDGSEFAWLIPLALLVLATRARSGVFDPSAIREVAEWVSTEEARERATYYGRMGIDLNDLPALPFGVRQGFWQPAFDELQRAAMSLPDGPIRESVQLASLLIEPKW